MFIAIFIFAFIACFITWYIGTWLSKLFAADLENNEYFQYLKIQQELEIEKNQELKQRLAKIQNKPKRAKTPEHIKALIFALISSVCITGFIYVKTLPMRYAMEKFQESMEN